MIQSVLVQGLGAMGLLFAKRVADAQAGGQAVKQTILADRERIARYTNAQHIVNGRDYRFTYTTPEDAEAADLIVVAVKSNHLAEAMEQLKGAVKEGTIIISLLNGISSETELQTRYPEARVVTVMSQGMDATREDRELRYTHEGTIVMGLMPTDDKARIEPAIQETAEFFDRMQVAYRISDEMAKDVWGKWLLNTGINQTVSYYEGTYDTVQQPGEARDTMIAAMREAAACATAEEIPLGEEDIRYWLSVGDSLGPENMPSMRQDQLAGRPMETDLFCETVIALGKKHGIATPVNERFCQKLGE